MVPDPAPAPSRRSRLVRPADYADLSAGAPGRLAVGEVRLVRAGGTRTDRRDPCRRNTVLEQDLPVGGTQVELPMRAGGLPGIRHGPPTVDELLTDCRLDLVTAAADRRPHR